RPYVYRGNIARTLARPVCGFLSVQYRFWYRGCVCIQLLSCRYSGRLALDVGRAGDTIPGVCHLVIHDSGEPPLVSEKATRRGGRARIHENRCGGYHGPTDRRESVVPIVVER